MRVDLSWRDWKEKAQTEVKKQSVVLKATEEIDGKMKYTQNIFKYVLASNEQQTAI